MLEGVSSNIRLEGGYLLCTGDTNPGVNFSTSWVMIYGGGWVQAGTMYRYGYGSCVKYWAEDKANGTAGFYDWYLGGCAPQDGSTHNFQVKSYFTGSKWVFQSYADTSNLIRQSTFGITDWAGNAVNVAYDGETYYPESNVPGSAGSPQYYSLMYVQNYSNDNWYDVCGNVGLQQILYSGVAPYWGVSAPSCDTSSYWSKTN